MENGHINIVYNAGISVESFVEKKKCLIWIEKQEAILSSLRLRDIPAQLRGFNLKTVKLNYNFITQISSSFVSEMPNLEVFEIDHNFLLCFPWNIGEWTKLRHLSATNNEIKQLPLTFSKLNNLRYLNLRSNPLSDAFSYWFDFDDKVEWTERKCLIAARRSFYFMRQYKYALFGESTEDQVLEKFRKELTPQLQFIWPELEIRIGDNEMNTNYLVGHFFKLDFMDEKQPVEESEREICLQEMKSLKEKHLSKKNGPKARPFRFQDYMINLNDFLFLLLFGSLIYLLFAFCYPDEQRYKEVMAELEANATQNKPEPEPSIWTLLTFKFAYVDLPGQG